MLSRADSRKKAGGVSGNGKFLNDLETLSKAFYVDKTVSRLASSTASSRSKSIGKSHLPEPKVKPKDPKNNNKDSFDKDKKSSIWSWKGLKSLTHVRNRRFDCCFSLLVQSIEGLPAFFDDVCLVVHWKRRDGEQTTRPIRVSQGVAEFEEQLTHSCSVYGSRSGPHHSVKYEAKHFLLFVSVYDAPELDLGKHRIDLTRLLPLTLEELEEEKSSGKWTTSFRLSGKARGATMNVSFGYDVVTENSSTELSCNRTVPDILSSLQNSARTAKIMGPSDQMDGLCIHRAGSLPARPSALNQSAEDIKDLHEVLPISRSELRDSVNILYQKLDEEASSSSVENKLEADALSSPTDPHKADLFTPPDADEKIYGPECEMTESFDPHKADLFTPPDADEKNCGPECEMTEFSDPHKADLFTPPDADEKICGPACGMTEFSVIDEGVEELTKEHLETEDESSKIAQGSGIAIEVALDEEAPAHPSAVEGVPQNDEQSPSHCKEKENYMFSKESLMKELEAALSCTSDLVNEGLDSQEDGTDALDLENYLEVDSDHGDSRKGKSASLDDVADSVANDFLEMLGIEHSPFGLSSESEPESPRERLLRQFEKDVLSNGGLLNFDIYDDPAELFNDSPMGSVWEPISEDFHHSSMFEGLGEMSKIETDAFRTKTRASRMEDLETEALMHEWGLNEKVFLNSPPSSSGGFGSPIDLPPEDPQQLPPLAEGLGPFVQTKDGGFLRSMNPALFKNAKSGGSLIMQVSNPVVVPAEMGSGVMDILQGLASVGIEKLSMQANRLMPLEDITGKTVQQIAWEGALTLEGPERQDLLHQESEIRHNFPSEQKSVKEIRTAPGSNTFDSSSLSSDTEYVSLEDLAPLAMDKIEALSIEGLRIQSGMSDEDAPSNISSQSIGEFSALKGKTADVVGSIGLDGTCGLQLMDIKDNGEEVDGLMGLSLTLDEWMKLDSGEIADDDLVSERTSKILAAHHATSLDQFRGRSKGEKRRSRSRKYGLLGNNFTVALMVQLRDPLRNYEPVGTPMLALIQVERVFVPPKPKIYGTVSLLRNSNEDGEVPKPSKKEKIIEKPKEDEIHEEELIPQYKITEVRVAGPKTEPDKKKLWGSTNQQQSGSRWLLANGMGKKNKHPLMKSKAVAPMTTTAQPKNTLWSISNRAKNRG
ncbi:protein PLASTID MOVEMENT IMPAIRED 1-RELATED 1 [Sesamum alatum]|uniref:Protein PLASTID MOVEMENT IMPAIRED 1-RELATED 1 n=1 Tax=Sesamum alatum TaxID=300844 RepID=A0AAE1XPM4_9LAMI|nr:protein PLASTID MOVEMENT IMPAIRED 1-RELATED 1 [Sesamum alatum]